MIYYDTLKKLNVDIFKLTMFYFVMNGYQLDDTREVFYCGKAGSILKRCGLKSSTVEITASQRAIRKILGVESGYKEDKDCAHGRSITEAVNLPVLINAPVLVIGGNDTNSSRLVFIEIKRQGRKMFVVLDLKIKVVKVFGKRQKSYSISTAYSKDYASIREKIEQAIAMQTVFYYNKSKISSWLKAGGLGDLQKKIEANAEFFT